MFRIDKSDSAGDHDWNQLENTEACGGRSTKPTSCVKKQQSTEYLAVLAIRANIGYTHPKAGSPNPPRVSETRHAGTESLERFGRDGNSSEEASMLGRTRVSNNSLASCSIVAESLLRELRNDVGNDAEKSGSSDERRETAKVLAQTLLRVLDGYKFGALRKDHAHHGVLHRTTLTPKFRVDREQSGQMQEALTRAKDAVFPAMATDDTVRVLSDTIRTEFGLLTPAARQQSHRVELERFLVRLVSELEPAA